MVKTHRVVEAIENTILVGFGRSHLDPRSRCISDRVTGNYGVVCATGDGCRISVSKKIGRRAGRRVGEWVCGWAKFYNCFTKLTPLHRPSHSTEGGGFR